VGVHRLEAYAHPRRSRRRRSSWTSCAGWSVLGFGAHNATGLLIDPGDGLRVINEVEQLAAFEYAACQTSQGVRNLLFGLRPGMTEAEAVRLLEWNGMPLSCHLMLTADRAPPTACSARARAGSSGATGSRWHSACGAR
jgi:hypothetical protein